MRTFRDTTQSAFATFELPKETGARKRRQNSGKGKEKVATDNAAASRKKPKSLNLFTYKWHALGDYVRAIHLFGGTDGFSTQVVSKFFPYVFDLFTPSDQQGELAHKIVKRLYRSTNKRNSEPQIAKRYRRLEHARLALDRKRLHNHTKQKTTHQNDNQPDGDSDLRYYISPSKNHPQGILSTLRDNRGDPAYHVRFPD
jgi:hypothetical protein